MLFDHKQCSLIRGLVNVAAHNENLVVLFIHFMFLVHDLRPCASFVC